MGYRQHDPPTSLLIGYDPVVDLPKDDLARLVEMVVEEAISPTASPVGPGQPGYDPRLCIKVLIHGYSTGVRPSRQFARCSLADARVTMSRGIVQQSTSGPG